MLLVWLLRFLGVNCLDVRSKFASLLLEVTIVLFGFSVNNKGVAVLLISFQQIALR